VRKNPERTADIRHVKTSAGHAAVYLILTAAIIYTLFPIYFLVVNSFKSQAEIVRDPVALPSSPTFSYIISAAESINFLKSLAVTAFVTGTALLIIILTSSMCAWIMVRCKTKISSFVLLLFISAMLIPFQAVMYPLISFMDSINFKNIYGLIVMYGGFGLSISVFLYHGFVKSVPQGIEEAAVIDGANIYQLFFKVVFPLLKSTTVTVIILNGMWIWNDYLLPFLVIGNREGIKTLTLELYFAKITSGQFGNPWQLIFPAVLISIIPMTAVFIALQKYFIKGISEGALKS